VSRLTPPLNRQDLWRLRETALRSPALPVLWKIVERGVQVALDERGRLVVRPAGEIRTEELIVLRQWPEATRTLVALATANVVCPQYLM
jgi:hypothetical protein